MKEIAQAWAMVPGCCSFGVVAVSLLALVLDYREKTKQAGKLQCGRDDIYDKHTNMHRHPR